MAATVGILLFPTELVNLIIVGICKILETTVRGPGRAFADQYGRSSPG